MIDFAQESNYMEKGNCNVRKPGNLIKAGQSYKRSLWTEIWTTLEYLSLITVQKLLYISYLERTEKEVTPGTSHTEKHFSNTKC